MVKNMKIALTGTPGTGKTSVSRILENKYHVIYLNDFKDVREYYDRERDTYVVNINKLREKIENMNMKGTVILEGHYAHDMGVDMVIVLRCHPDELRKRLKLRNYSDLKIMENVEAEAMGIISEECLSLYLEENVYEIDTTQKSVEDVANAIIQIIEGRGKEYRKRLNYMEEILKWY